MKTLVESKTVLTVLRAVVVFAFIFRHRAVVVFELFFSQIYNLLNIKLLTREFD